VGNGMTIGTTAEGQYEDDLAVMALARNPMSGGHYRFNIARKNQGKTETKLINLFFYRGVTMNTNDEFKSIAELDLNPIKTKLMHVESGEGWSRQKADSVEFEYRRFLMLMKKFPDELTAPSVDVDSFWHYHILDTMKYAVDCQQVFGYFLHHYPYIGLHSEADEGEQARAGESMRELYQLTFGAASHEGAPATSAWCGAQAMTAWCGATTGKPTVAVEAANVAWCGATTGKPAVAVEAANVAWCGATTGKPAVAVEAGNVAWCGARQAAGLVQLGVAA
jgi:hypothetical protein